MAGVKEAGTTFWTVGNEPAWHLAIFPEEKRVFVGHYDETTVITPDPGASMEEEAFDYQVKITSNETGRDLRVAQGASR